MAHEQIDPAALADLSTWSVGRPHHLFDALRNNVRPWLIQDADEAERLVRGLRCQFEASLRT
jgi:hypothetical protein